MHLLSKGENSRRVHDLIRETVQTFSPPYLITQEAHWNCIPDLPLLNDLELSGAIALFESLRVDEKRVMTAIEKNRNHLRTEDWDSFLSDGLPLRLVKGDTTYYKKELPTDVVAAYAPLVHHAKALFYKVWASQTRGTWETLHRVHTELTKSTGCHYTSIPLQAPPTGGAGHSLYNCQPTHSLFSKPDSYPVGGA